MTYAPGLGEAIVIALCSLISGFFSGFLGVGAGVICLIVWRVAENIFGVDLGVDLMDSSRKLLAISSILSLAQYPVSILELRRQPQVHWRIDIFIYTFLGFNGLIWLGSYFAVSLNQEALLIVLGTSLVLISMWMFTKQSILDRKVDDELTKNGMLEELESKYNKNANNNNNNNHNNHNNNHNNDRYNNNINNPDAAGTTLDSLHSTYDLDSYQTKQQQQQQQQQQSEEQKNPSPQKKILRQRPPRLNKIGSITEEPDIEQNTTTESDQAPTTPKQVGASPFMNPHNNNNNNASDAAGQDLTLFIPIHHANSTLTPATAAGHGGPTTPTNNNNFNNNNNNKPPFPPLSPRSPAAGGGARMPRTRSLLYSSDGQIVTTSSSLHAQMKKNKINATDLRRHEERVNRQYIPCIEEYDGQSEDGQSVYSSHYSSHRPQLQQHPTVTAIDPQQTYFDQHREAAAPPVVVEETDPAKIPPTLDTHSLIEVCQWYVVNDTKSILFGTLLGAGAGLSNGLWGIASPLLSIYFNLVLSLSGTEVRDTSLLIYFGNIPCLIFARILFAIWRWDEWLIYLAVVPITLGGLKLGFFLHDFVSNQRFILNAVQLIICFSSIPLTKPLGIDPVAGPRSVVFLITYIVVVALLILFVWWRNRRDEKIKQDLLDEYVEMLQLAASTNWSQNGGTPPQYQQQQQHGYYPQQQPNSPRQYRDINNNESSQHEFLEMQTQYQIAINPKTPTTGAVAAPGGGQIDPFALDVSTSYSSQLPQQQQQQEQTQQYHDQEFQQISPRV